MFDSGNQRYEKLRESAQSSVLSQIGLAIFTQDRNTLNYEVETYNFYLCPQSCGSQDKRFLCQASSFEFLARHKFDFNKVNISQHLQCLMIGIWFHDNVFSVLRISTLIYDNIIVHTN